MTHYWIYPRDPIFVKSYGFLPFTENMGKTIGKSLSSKYSHRPFDHQSAIAPLKSAPERAT